MDEDISQLQVELSDNKSEKCSEHDGSHSKTRSSHAVILNANLRRMWSKFREEEERILLWPEANEGGTDDYIKHKHLI
jgi:hypothetical protein